MAVSPPPTDATSNPFAKNPSQVAHALTPCPFSRSSLGSPSHLASAPVATITARPPYTSSFTHTLIGVFFQSSRVTLLSTKSPWDRSAFFRHHFLISGPRISLG